MIQYQMSKFFKTRERAVLPGTPFKEEGIAIALVREDGALYATPCTGAAGETFGGFTMSTNVPTSFSTEIDTVPAVPVVMLPRVPVTGQLYVAIDGQPATVSVGTDAPTAAGKVTLNDRQLLVHADDVGKDLYYQFHYELTASEASEVTGDYYGGSHNAAGVKMNSVGAVIEGQVATNMFDASKDWSNVMHPRLGENGMLTTDGSGTLLTNVVIAGVPNADTPFLFVEVNNG